MLEKKVVRNENKIIKNPLRSPTKNDIFFQNQKKYENPVFGFSGFSGFSGCGFLGYTGLE